MTNQEDEFNLKEKLEEMTRNLKERDTKFKVAIDSQNINKLGCAGVKLLVELKLSEGLSQVRLVRLGQLIQLDSISQVRLGQSDQIRLGQLGQVSQVR